MPDPIAPVISALSLLVTPSPALATAAPFPAVTAWSGAATTGSAYTPIQTLLGILFGASSDMDAVGKGINTGLTDVAGVLTKLATGLASLPDGTTAANALSGLQQALTLAQTLAPGASATVLTSGSSLFQQLQGLLTAIPNVKQAADELAALAQQFSTLAKLFPST